MLASVCGGEKETFISSKWLFFISPSPYLHLHHEFWSWFLCICSWPVSVSVKWTLTPPCQTMSINVKGQSLSRRMVDLPYNLAAVPRTDFAKYWPISPSPYLFYPLFPFFSINGDCFTMFCWLLTIVLYCRWPHPSCLQLIRFSICILGAKHVWQTSSCFDWASLIGSSGSWLHQIWPILFTGPFLFSLWPLVIANPNIKYYSTEQTPLIYLILICNMEQKAFDKPVLLQLFLLPTPVPTSDFLLAHFEMTYVPKCFHTFMSTLNRLVIQIASLACTAFTIDTRGLTFVENVTSMCYLNQRICPLSLGIRYASVPQFTSSEPRRPQRCPFRMILYRGTIVVGQK